MDQSTHPQMGCGMSLEVDVRSRFGNFEIEAAFEAGFGLTALFGHSGSGKTTILKMISGLTRPDEGRIVVDGRVLFDSLNRVDVAPSDRRIAMVFQDARLFPHMTVRRNLTYGRWAGKRRSSLALDRVTDLLGIGGLLERYPGRLSGGEKQRVAIGRAMLADPAILLMDEPLASLDQARKQEILPFLEEIRDDTGVPIVYVSHEVDEVARLADTLVLLAGGRMLGAGDAVSMFARLDFGPALGRHEASSLLIGSVIEVDENYGLTIVSLDEGARISIVSGAYRPGERLRMRIKARDVALSVGRPDGVSFRNVLPARVEEIVRDESPFVELMLRVGGQALRARITRQALDDLGIGRGDRIFAMVKSVAIGRRTLSSLSDDAASGSDGVSA
jgi:molybdate transport system ATP-binding protein